MSRRNLVLAGVAGVLSLLVSASAGAQSNNLLALINATPDTSRFAAMVKAAGLDAIFTAPGRHTVFAPNNAAIEQIPPLRFQSLMADPAKLRAVVQNHVLNGEVMINTSIAEQGQMGTDNHRSLSGQIVAVSFGSGGLPRANGVSVTSPNLRASNGVMHVVSGVFEN